jgi:nucleoside-diphosphate-sugar epimerase
MSHYLLTGAAGFIGARVTELLLEQGHQVVGLDNLNPAYDVRMKEHRLGRLMALPGFQFHKVDICDGRALRALPQGAPVEAVIHLAARAGVRASLEDPWSYVETNAGGTLNLLELCRHTRISKFVLASTSSIYGAGAPLPTPEEADSDRPLQPYAASKKAAEVLSYSYHALYGLDVTVFRYFTVYGPAGRPDMSMFRFTQWIAEERPLMLNGDGSQSRGFTYVDDIARGTILGLRPVGYEIMNLGGHEAVRMTEVIRMLEGLLGTKAHIVQQPAHPADMPASWANVEKARRVLGWEPRVSFAEGARELVAWYRHERDWARTVATG